MSYYDLVFYCNAGDQATTGYYALAKWAASTAIAAGVLRRQLAVPAVGNERIFICIVAGTTGASEPAWSLVRGAKTTDATVTWMECTGMAAVNGDATNTLTRAAAYAVSSIPSLGVIIRRDNGASYQICTTSSGAMSGVTPTFSDTPGVTTTDGSIVWTCIGLAGAFSGGQAPHARLGNVFAVNFIVGATVYVGDNHAESQASSYTTINVPGAASGVINRILCHDHAGSYPPTAVAIGATVTTTGNSPLQLSGVSTYIYGITFKASVGGFSGFGVLVGNSSTMGQQPWIYFDNCSLQQLGTGASTSMAIGAGSINSQGVVTLNNTTLAFGATGQCLVVTAMVFRWQNTGPVLAAGSSIPTSLFNASTNLQALNEIVLEALDLSQITGALVGTGATFTGVTFIKDCKLNASVTVPSPLTSGMTVQLARCTTSYGSTRYQYEGIETTETSIIRSGGATDPTGQQQSRKIVTTANSQWLRPFKAEPYAVWNDRVGAPVTLTVCGVANGPLPLTDEVWLEVEYLLGSVSSPIGTIVTTTKSNVLAIGAPVPADVSTWANAVTGLVTLDPSTSAFVTLSNGNLTVTAPSSIGGSAGARSPDGLAKTSGKTYFECLLVVQAASGDGVSGVGVGTTTSTYGSMNTNATAGVEVYFGTGNIWANGSSTGISLGGRVNGDVIGIAVDFDNRQIWFKKVSGTPGNWNNSGTANPATNTGGIAVPPGAMVQFNTLSASHSHTLNFGASAFTGTAPSGFTTGWMSVWTPFKLTTTLSSPSPGLRGYIHARVRAAKPNATFCIDPQITLS